MIKLQTTVEYDKYNRMIKLRVGLNRTFFYIYYRKDIQFVCVMIRLIIIHITEDFKQIGCGSKRPSHSNALHVININMDGDC